MIVGPLVDNLLPLEASYRDQDLDLVARRLQGICLNQYPQKIVFELAQVFYLLGLGKIFQFSDSFTHPLIKITRVLHK